MAAISKTEVWDAAWTLTGRARRKRLTDNISDSYPTIQAFRGAGILETEVGGKEIQEDIMYALNTSEWFDGYDILNTDAVDGITAAFYPWRYNATPVTISMTEETEAENAEGAVGLLESKQKQTMITGLDTNNAAILAAQSGKSILGVQDLISTTAGSTIGGINSTTETWWDNQRMNYSSGTASCSTNRFGVLHTIWTSSFNGIVAMRDLWSLCSEGNDQPNLIITSYEVGGAYESIYEGTGYLRLTSRDKNDVDGSNPTYRGARIIQDRDCPYTAGDGRMYFLNKKYLKYKVLKGKNMAKTPFKEPTNQMAKVCYVIHGSQLVTNHRARQGVLHAITI